MYFKVLKSSFDGICGRSSRFDKIEDVLQEISYHKGWDSLKELHTAIKKWAKIATPGSIFCTQVSAVIAFPVDSSLRECDICHHCNYDGGLDYGDIDAVEGGNLEQRVSCPECGRKWIDEFTLADQRELA